jgi:hypothetical protein
LKTAKRRPGDGKRKTRPRGFAAWDPQPESLALVEQVRAVLSLFRAYLPVTIRQVFYRLVSTVGYPKDEQAYGRLCDTLNRARRAGLLPWGDFRDDGFTRVAPTSWDSPSDWARAVLASAKSYRVDRQRGQERRLVLWCEAAGMVPQLARVADEYSVSVFSSGGFDSVTAKHQIAEEFASLGDATVLHVGDLDPSGVHMFGSLDEDIRAFLDRLGAAGRVEFVRLAVTREQVEELGLPTAPAKKSDRRSFIGDTVQAEAIPPDELARTVRGAILDRFDGHGLEGILYLEDQERARLVEQVSALLESLK